MNLKAIRNALEREKGRKDGVIEAIGLKEKELRQTERDYKNTSDAIPIAQLVAQQTQDELKYEISELVTLALSAVFDEPYDFCIDFELKRGKTEAVITFERDGEKVDPMDSTGGGAVDVAAFALRVALWNLKRPKSANIIILDEPGRFVSSDLQPRFGDMISEIAKKLKIQFIIVTHNQAIIESADKVFRVKKIKGVSNVKEV